MRDATCYLLVGARVLKLANELENGATGRQNSQLTNTSPYAREYDTVRETYEAVRATYEQRYEQRLRTPYEPRLR